MEIRKSDLRYHPIMTIMFKTCPFVLLFSLISVTSYAQKRPLDHDVYEIWNQLSEWEISNDGQWGFYQYGPEKGEDTLMIQSLTDTEAYQIPRGNSAIFTHDSQYAIYLVSPSDETLRAAKKADVEEDHLPKDSLGILNLDTGSEHYITDVDSYQIPSDVTNVVAYLLEETDADSTGNGQTLHIHELETGMEHDFPHVQDYKVSPNGAHLAYTYAGHDSLDTGIILVHLSQITSDTLLSGGGEYSKLSFDEIGNQLAFLSSHQGHALDPVEYALYYWHREIDSVSTVATAMNPALSDGWWISPHADLRFSDNGQRLYFGTAVKPPAEAEEDEDRAVLDVWNWKDPLLQPMQLVNVDEERERSYRAVLHLDSRDLVQLADMEMPDIVVGSEGNSDIGIGWSNLTYQQQISWDSPRAYDTFIFNVTDGSKIKVLEGVQYRPTLSPDAKYITWWDRDQSAWMALSTDGDAPINLTASIDVSVHNEIHDWPYAPDPYGDAGWSQNDEEFLIYDRYDIWAINPQDVASPRNVTQGIGRSLNMRFRYINLDTDEEFIPDQILLSAFNIDSKASGYYALRLDRNNPPTELIMMDKQFRGPQKAESADQLLFTRESFTDPRDLWTSKSDFSNLRQVSGINPQQAQYSWGTAELVNWTSLDGIPLTGMLFKPDGFDPSNTYPMMVYFYEKMSNGLHQYRPPVTARSSISFSFYVSRGYVVFVPDIPYKVGYPGESALNAVVPGVTMLINQGFIDPDRVGVQGHSWGGYQIAYMITESDLFAAAEAGAPVVNMTSAYGGIRWASGMSRMFQYERTQSRIGGSLWETPLRYLDNSPLFQADKIKTPLLMLHNDDDGAVPWYQGIEFFVALRRLEKPVWMLNYNGEGHGLSKYPNRKDFAIRMQQFFDHYLQDAPAPVWMKDGIPAVDKGETLGLELTPDQ